MNANTFGAIILAAGKSSRMGQPKMNLPWKNTTVLGAVVRGLSNAGIKKIFIVINPHRVPFIDEEMKTRTVRLVENPDAEKSEMLISMQVGLQALPAGIDYVFICLGDQPVIDEGVIDQLKLLAMEKNAPLIIPSYNMHRGHPWLVRKDMIAEILGLEKTDTVRTFINRHADEILYVNINKEMPPDMDTPEEYQNLISRYG